MAVWWLVCFLALHLRKLSILYWNDRQRRLTMHQSLTIGPITVRNPERSYKAFVTHLICSTV